ncbi:MAG: carboxypeptidase regulatory-like domain-containing protein [Verrucomicrobia bacterium]|nr:carboxypeptidase regulatory-like domain-containing protein [Verrucomicrobiota bacterium]
MKIPPACARLWLAALIGLATIPAARAQLGAAGPLPLDLTRILHTNFFAPGFKGAAASIPKGVQQFDGLPFQIVGQAGFFGQSLAERRQFYPEQALGIVVGRKFDELHLIHHAFWPDAEGRTIATIRLNYADGSHADLGIGFGTHVRDWFRLPADEKDAPTDPNSKIIWRGTSTAAERLKATMRLYKGMIANPQPGKLVRTLDIFSAHAAASYCLLAATVAGADANRPVTPAVAPDQDRVFDGEVKFTVLDADTGQPIAGALLDGGMTVKDAGVVHPPLTTDKNGEQRLRYPKTDTTSIYVVAKADGYTSKSVSWRGAEAPPEYTFRLKAGDAIGGFVRDESGLPIARAHITASGRGGTDSFSSATGMSGDDGRWTIKGVPKGAQNLSLEAVHPEFPPRQFHAGSASGDPRAPSVSAEELFNQTAVLTLERGLTLTGRVENEAGRAVTNATLRLGENLWDDSLVTAKTDPEGKFELKKVRPGESKLTTQAGGYSPDVRQLTISAQTEPLVIVLAKGSFIRGRVVDKDGNPVPDAAVSVADAANGGALLTWNGKTDAEGFFTWNAAPASGARLDIRKAGYYSIRYRTVRPSAEVQLFVLNRALRVTGTVRDAQSGEPVAEFKVVTGYPQNFRATSTNAPVYQWNDYSAKRFTNGQFTLTSTDPTVIGRETDPDLVLKIQAKGYAPAVSRLIPVSEGEATLDFALERAAEILVRVTTPDGQPATNASVALNDGNGGAAYLSGGQFLHLGMTDQRLRTDSNGQVALPPTLGDYLVVAAGDGGFAKATRAGIAASPLLTLQPWARLEGVKRNGRRAAAGETLGLTFDTTYQFGQPHVMINDTATTGRDGRFTFERLPPGTLRLHQRVPMGQGMWSHRELQTVELKPGETNHIVIGSDGTLEITGRLVRPAGLDKLASLTNGQFEIRLAAARPVVPKDFKSQEEIQKWFADWMKTDAGKRFTQAQQEVTAATVSPDGSFTADGLKPGSYIFSVVVSRKLPRGIPLSRSEDILATATKEFELKAPEKPDDDRPFDLGKVQLKIRRTLKVGDVAPDFAIKTVDGKPLKLADFKGRFALLDFWATWCGPCVTELPFLKTAFEALREDKRFAMISLSLDDDAAAPKKFAADNELKWTQGFLGDWSKSSLPGEYGVEGIPSLFLVGPDGKIAAKGMRGDAIEETVKKAMGKP